MATATNVIKQLKQQVSDLSYELAIARAEVEDLRDELKLAAQEREAMMAEIQLPESLDNPE
jgi:chromosome segregation ATPase